MDSVDVAMVRSLRAGPVEKIKTALAYSILSQSTKKDVIGDAQQKITDVKTAFSSWDNCMKAVFCKWPVIAVIVVGSLIILAIIWCIIRCAWCGVSCCCSCFHCLKCCGECCGCCDPPRRAQRKYLDEPFIPPHQGYRTEAPMQAPFASRHQPVPPQYAEFDMSKKGPEDSLPQMPSWESAGSKKVEVETEAVEMNQLKSPASDPGQPLLNGPPHSGQNSPMPMDRPTPSPSPYGPPRGSPQGAMSPSPSLSPYGTPRGPPQGAMMRNQQPMSPNLYAPQNQGTLHPGMGQNPYQDQKRESVGFGLDDEPYDTPPVSAPMPPAQSPAPAYHSQGPPQMENAFAEMPAAPDDSTVQDPRSQTPRMPPTGASGGGPPGYGMRRQGTGDSARNSPVPYGMDPRMTNSPAPGPGPDRRTPGTPGPRDGAFAQPPRGSPAPPQDSFGGHGRPGFNGSSSPRPHPDRMYSPGPGRQPRDQSYSPALNRDFARAPVDRTYSPASPRPNGQDRVDRTFSPGPPRPNPQDRTFSPAPPRGFAEDQTQRAYSPAPPGPPPNRSYSGAAPQTHPSADQEQSSTPDRPLNMPDRSFAATPGHGTELHMSRPFGDSDSAPGSPLTNNGGFDFVSGNSRPNRPSESNDDSAQAYPGHKPYRAN